MTANKSLKAVARAGDGKAARDIPDRSVTSGTEKGQSGGGGGVSLFTLYSCSTSMEPKICLHCVCCCLLLIKFLFDPEFWPLWTSTAVSIVM